MRIAWRQLGLLSFLLSCCIALNDNNQNARNLILSEQELRLAGASLRTIFSSNMNYYQSRKKRSRRFTGSFAIVERENSCGDFEVQMNVQFETFNNYNENRGRDQSNNYNQNNNNYTQNGFGISAQGSFGATGFAG